MFVKQDRNVEPGNNSGGLPYSSQAKKLMACMMQHKCNTMNALPWRPCCMPSFMVTDVESKVAANHFDRDFDDVLCYKKSLEQMNHKPRGSCGFGWPTYSRKVCDPTSRDTNESDGSGGSSTMDSDSVYKQGSLCMNHKPDRAADPTSAAEPATYASVLKKPKILTNIMSNNGDMNVKKPYLKVGPGVSVNVKCIGLRHLPGSCQRVVDHKVGDLDRSAVNNRKPKPTRRTIPNKMDYLRDLLANSDPAHSALPLRIHGATSIGRTAGGLPEGGKWKTASSVPAGSSGTSCIDKGQSSGVHELLASAQTSLPKRNMWTVETSPVMRGCQNALISFIMGFGVAESVDEDNSEPDDASDWETESGEDDDDNSNDDFVPLKEKQNGGRASEMELRVDDSHNDEHGVSSEMEVSCTPGLERLQFCHDMSEAELVLANSRWQKAYDVCDSATPSRSHKKVSFANDKSLRTVHVVPCFSRKGHWEELARDRHRFAKRIHETGLVLNPILQPDFRHQVYVNRMLTSNKNL